MTKISLLALQSQVYAGRRLAAGVEFEARGATDARLLIAIGRADFAPARVGDSAPVVAPTREPVAAPDPLPEPEALVEIKAPAVEAPADPDPIAVQPVETTAAEVEQQPEPGAEPGEPAEEQAPQAEEQPADADLSPRTGKPKRAYRRRDMQAEGTEG